MSVVQYQDRESLPPDRYPTAQRFEKDPVTGFIVVSGEALMGPGLVTDGGLLPEQAFQPSLKLEFIKLLKNMWPDVGEACERIGISFKTYRNHLEADPKFRDYIEDIASKRTSRIENFQADLAETNKFAFMDRAMYLRANNPEKFDPARRIIVSETPRIDEPTARLRMANLKRCVDAEIVSEGLRELEERKEKKSR